MRRGAVPDGVDGGPLSAMAVNGPDSLPAQRGGILRSAPVETMNLLIKQVKRSARARNFDNYHLRILRAEADAGRDTSG